MVQVNLTGPNYREAVDTQDELAVKDLHQEYKSALDDISTINTLLEKGGKVIDTMAQGHFEEALLGPQGEFLGEEGIFQQGLLAGSNLDDVDANGVPVPVDTTEAKAHFDEEYEKLVQGSPLMYRAILRGKKAGVKGKYTALVEERAYMERDVALSRMSSDEGTKEDWARILRSQGLIRNPNLRVDSLNRTSLQYVNAATSEARSPLIGLQTLDAAIGAANVIARYDMSSEAEGAARANASERAEAYASSEEGRAHLAFSVVTGMDSGDHLQAARLFMVTLGGETADWADTFRALVPALERNRAGGIYTAGDAALLLDSVTPQVLDAARTVNTGVIKGLFERVFQSHTKVDVSVADDEAILDVLMELEQEHIRNPTNQVADMLAALETYVGKTTVVARRGAASGKGVPWANTPSIDNVKESGAIGALVEAGILPEGAKFRRITKALKDFSAHSKRAFVEQWISIAGRKGNGTTPGFMGMLSMIEDRLEIPGARLVNDGAGIPQVVYPIPGPEGIYRNVLTRGRVEVSPGIEGQGEVVRPYGERSTRPVGTTVPPVGGPLIDSDGTPNPDVVEVGDTGDIEVPDRTGSPSDTDQFAGMILGDGARSNEEQGRIDDLIVSIQEKRLGKEEEVKPVEPMHAYVAAVMLGRLVQYGAKDGRGVRLLESLLSKGAREGIYSGMSVLEKMTRGKGTPVEVSKAIMKFLKDAPLGKKVALELGEVALQQISETAQGFGENPHNIEKMRKAVQKEMYKSIKENLNPKKLLRGHWEVVKWLSTGAANIVSKTPEGAYGWARNAAKWTGKQIMHHLRNPMTIATGLRRLISLPWLLADVAVTEGSEANIEGRERHATESQSERSIVPKSDGEALRDILIASGASDLTGGAFFESGPGRSKDGTFFAAGFDMFTDLIKTAAPGGIPITTNREQDIYELAVGSGEIITAGAYNAIPSRLYEDLYPKEEREGIKWYGGAFNHTIHVVQESVANEGLLLPFRPVTDHTQPYRETPPAGRRIFGTKGNPVEYREDHIYTVYGSPGDREDYGRRLYEYVLSNPNDREAAVLMEDWVEEGKAGMATLLDLAQAFPLDQMHYSEVFTPENLTVEGWKAVHGPGLADTQNVGDPHDNEPAVRLPVRLPVEMSVDEFIETIEPLIEHDNAHTYFKSLLPPMPQQDAMVRISGIGITGSHHMKWELTANDQFNHFVVWRTLRRMEDGGFDPSAVPRSDAERAADLSGDWLEFLSLEGAMNDVDLPGYMDEDEWQKKAAEVGTQAALMFGPKFSRLQDHFKGAPGLEFRRSLDRVGIVRDLDETLDRLRSKERPDLAHYGGFITGFMEGKSKEKVLSEQEDATVFTGGTNWMPTLFGGSVEIPAHHAERARGLVLSRAIEQWSLALSTIETQASLPTRSQMDTGYEIMHRKPSTRRNFPGLYTQDQVRAASTVFFRPKGTDQWIPLHSMKSAVDDMRRYHRLVHLKKEFEWSHEEGDQ